MEANERLEQTKKNLIDTTNMVEPEKVPTSIDFGGWPYGYSGTTYEEIHDDPVKVTEVYMKAVNDVNPDMLGTASTGTYCVDAYKALGSHKHFYNGSGTTHDQAGQTFFGPEIYDEIIANGTYALADKILRKDYPSFSKPKEEAYEDLKKAFYAFKTKFDSDFMIADAVAAKGIYTYDAEAPINYWGELFAIFDRYRGIKDTLADLRRYKDKVAEAVEVMWQEVLPMYEYNPADMASPLPMADTMFHPEGFLSPKQFDDFYFKHFMKVMGPAMEAGKKVFLYGEGTFIRHLDRFLETPKGAMVIMLDSNSPYEVNKILGGHATLVCGIESGLLCGGSKEKCVEEVDRLFDALAPGGGFIYSTNQEIVTYKDVNAENLIAVFDEANRIGRK